MRDDTADLQEVLYDGGKEIPSICDFQITTNIKKIKNTNKID